MPTATIYAADFFHAAWIVAGDVHNINNISSMNCRRRQFMLTLTAWIVAGDDLCREHWHELSLATIHATATIHAVTVSGGFLQSWARADCHFRPPLFSFVDSVTEGLWYPSSEVVRVLHFVLFCMFWCFAFILFFACFCLSGTYSARRSVVSTCICALMCTHVYMRCVYTRSTCPLRLHRALVHSPVTVASSFSALAAMYLLCASCVF